MKARVDKERGIMDTGLIYTVRSLDEIIALKNDWKGDPCWDIEDTPGFEVWHDDLASWRRNYEDGLRHRESLRVGMKTAELGINATLLRYIESLERRIAQLEAKAK
jgi:hypothetical protein